VELRGVEVGRRRKRRKKMNEKLGFQWGLYRRENPNLKPLKSSI